MDRETLLAELDGLPHHSRMRRMAELGRAALSDPGLAALLQALEGGNAYERSLALQSCYGSRNGAHALRAPSDPSRLVRGLAIALIPLVCTDEQVREALTAATPRQRIPLLRRLTRRGRRAAVDLFLTTGAPAEDPSLLPLVPYGTAETAVTRVADAEQASAADWARLARHHPHLAAERLRLRAEAATGPDARLLWHANAALPFLAESAPEAATGLVHALAAHASLSQLELQRLALRRPAAVAELILAAGEASRVSLDRVAHRLDLAQLLALLDRAPGTLANTLLWFKRLSPQARRQVYEAAAPGWRRPDGSLPHERVALLPRDLREAEGRRHLALPGLATRPQERLPYASFLPWDEAQAALEPFIRNPDPDLRVAALRALVSTARYHRDHLSEVLRFVRAHKNEQDPVRGAMLGGLAELPPGAWREEHLADLGGVIREALNAADLSPTTAAYAERLVVALLPFHPEWSAPWLATLVQERGQVSFPNLEDRLSEADVQRIAPHLMPVLKSWERREREYHLLAAAYSLGRRLKAWGELADLLERLTGRSGHQYTAVQALSQLRRHCPERAARLIPQLVEKDGSWATQMPVYLHLHRHRQDLLTPFLGHKAYRGRFGTGRTRFLLPVSDGFHRWTPAQQALFAKTLSEVAGDTVRDTPAVLATIRQLRGLNYVPPDRVVQLASDRRDAVRDAALRALGTLDAGEGVPVLLIALEDDRARIAIYALRSAVLEMPPATAQELLGGVSMERVTVAKEVVRLLGDLRTEPAYRELLRLAGEDLHRDVRIALLRALWEHLEREETWPPLQEAAASPDAAVAMMAGRTQSERLSPRAQARLAALLAGLLGHPDPLVRKHVLDRCAVYPVADRERVLLRPLLRGMNSPLPEECTAAARAVFTLYTGEQASLVGEAVAATLPNRRSLWRVMEALHAALLRSRSRMEPTARAVLAALAADPLAVSLRLSLATAALPWDDLVTVYEQAASSGDLHPEGLFSALAALGKAGTRPDIGSIGDLEEPLAASDDDRLRRLALAALCARSAPPRGWTEERLARLEQYRRDPSPLVASPAQFTFPPQEPEGS